MYYPFKRLLTSFSSLLLAFTLTLYVLEKGPGTRKDFELVRNFESGIKHSSSVNEKSDFLLSLKQNLLQYGRGNFGESLTYRKEVKEVLFNHLSISLLYWGLSFFLTLTLGFGIAYIVSRNRASATYSCIKTFCLFLYKTPAFMVALFLLFWANSSLPRWAFKMEETPFSLAHPLTSLPHLWIPTLSYLAFLLPSFFLQLDAWVENEGKREYLTILKARGFSQVAIFFKHIVPNLFQLLFTSLPLMIRNLLVLSIAIEVTFQIHGFGYLSYLSFTTRDTPVLVGLFVTAGIIELSLNFLTDILSKKFSEIQRAPQYV